MENKVNLSKEALQQVEIALGREELEKKIDEIAREMRSFVSVRGFRKGKAPLKVIKQNFAKAIAEDAIKQLAFEVIENAAKEQGRDLFWVEVLDLSDLARKYVKNKQDVLATVSVEISPLLPDIEIEEIEFPESLIVPSDEMVEAKIKELLEENAIVKPIEDRDTPQKGDMVVMDFTLKAQGEAQKDQPFTDLEVILGANTSLFDTDEIADIVSKAKVGEEVEGEIEFAGTKVPVKIVVKELKEKEIPELTDEFVASLDMEGVKTVEDLKKKLTDDLKRYQLIANGPHILEHMADWFFKKNKDENIDVPEPMVAREIKRIWQEKYPHLYALTEDPEKLTEDEYKLLKSIDEQHIPATVAFLRANFLRKKLAKQLDINVSDADVDEYLEEFAAANKYPVEKLRPILSDEAWKQETEAYHVVKKIAEIRGLL